MRRKIDADPFGVSASPKLRNYSLGRTNKKKGFEVDLFSDKKDDFSAVKSLGVLIGKKKIAIWFFILLIGLLILLGRSAYLQLMKGDYYRAVAEGNRIRIHDIKSARGLFYDRHRNLLVKNIPSFSLALIPVDLPSDDRDLEELIQELSRISEKSVQEIKGIISEQSPYSYQPVILRENLTHDQAILTRILSSRFSGAALRIDSTRQYLAAPDVLSLSHLLGYQGKIAEPEKQEYLSQGYLLNDYIGKIGLEIFYEKELRGIYGKEQVEVDAVGQAKEIIACQKPVPGKNLVLTIDLELQKQAEQSLKKVLSNYGKKRGAAVILNPNSGEILAMVNWPSFDNNLFSQGISQDDFSSLINDENQPMFSRAVSGEYPSGSTFKLIVGAAALQEGIITPSTGFNSVGGIRISRWFFPDWKAGGHGWTNIYKAISESVNTFFYMIGGGHQDYDNIKYLGVEKMKEFAEMFGLNKKLGVDLPNEADGFFPSMEWKEKEKNERWYIGDTYHVAIGQGDVLVTPLQVAAWTSVFANGGILYKPYIVKEVLDFEDNIVKQIKPKVLNQDFINSEHIKTINRGLRQGVTTGSSKAMYGLPIKVAAKTGTAQWSSKKPPHAWLTAFAPYENPQIVVTVLVEEGEEGSRTALPVAYDIINWWARNR